MRIISGAFRGRTLKTVEGPGYRPAMSRVREALFSILESRGVVWCDCRILDLFAGSGSLAFEALSRGADEAWFVDLNPRATACIEKNALALGIDQRRWRIINEDLGRILCRRAAASFEIIFIDPPYGKNLLAPTLKSVLRNDWLADDGLVIAEVERGLPFDAEKAHEELEVLVDRLYGQTRIIVWAKRLEN